MAFVSTAAGPRYERPELDKADTLKTAGTWSKDDKGFWSLTSENKKVSGGWYHVNMLNSSTEYRWYHFDTKGIMATGWVADRKDPDIWYYTSEIKNRTEGSLVTGWVTDPQDGQKYYMDPATGQMSHGWVKIDNSWYYFAERKDVNRSWAPDANGYWTASNQTGHSYGSLYRDEMTPDGYYVDGRGEWKQSYGSSGSSSSRGERSRPDPVMTATATTSTPQYIGQQFDTTGLVIKLFNGVEYKTVTLPDSSVPEAGIKVTVNGVEGRTLSSGSNEVITAFVYYDPDVIIAQSITTEVFTVDAIKSFSVSDNTKVEFSPGLLYWDGDSFEFEESQTACSNTWNANHLNHLRWANNSGDLESDIGIAISDSADELTGNSEDVLFTNDGPTTARGNFTVNGETGVWRTLSKTEWDYLLNDERMENGKHSYSNCVNEGVTIGDTTYKGIFLYPDNYNGSEVSGSMTWRDINNAGIVFIPAVGIRSGMEMYEVGSEGYSWSSTPHEDEVRGAHAMYFVSEGEGTNYGNRDYGLCVRLVR